MTPDFVADYRRKPPASSTAPPPPPPPPSVASQPGFMMELPNACSKQDDKCAGGDGEEEKEEEEDPMSVFAIKRHAHLLRVTLKGPYLRAFFYKVKETDLWGFDFSVVTNSSLAKKYPDVLAKAVWKYRPANAFLW